MELKLSSPKAIEIITQESQIITTDTVVLSHIMDNGISAVAMIVIEGLSKTIVLWQGDEYKAIGDWTQSDANNRIIELL